MSFWNKSPGPTFKHYIKSIFSKPKAPEFLEPSVEQRSEPVRWTIRRATTDDIPEIIKFWHTHFRRPLSPVCVYNNEELLEQITTRDFILLVARGPKANNIYGTIMAQPLGRIKRAGVSTSWSNFNVHWIDFYCVNPLYWHQGVGSALLHAIVREGAEACIFLKEGEPLKSSMPSLRSSFYVYRHVSETEMEAEIEGRIIQWNSMQLSTFAQSLPIGIKTNYIIHEASSPTTSTAIFSYNGFRGQIVAVFNKSHEAHFENENKKLIWCTGLVRTGTLLDAEVNEAMLKLSAAAARHFNSPWVWMDGKHINPPPNSPWRIDGTFHIYAFHFDSGIYFNADPVLTL